MAGGFCEFPVDSEGALSQLALSGRFRRLTIGIYTVENTHLSLHSTS